MVVKRFAVKNNEGFIGLNELEEVVKQRGGEEVGASYFTTHQSEPREVRVYSLDQVTYIFEGNLDSSVQQLVMGGEKVKVERYEILFKNHYKFKLDEIILEEATA